MTRRGIILTNNAEIVVRKVVFLKASGFCADLNFLLTKRPLPLNTQFSREGIFELTVERFIDPAWPIFDMSMNTCRMSWIIALSDSLVRVNLLTDWFGRFRVTKYPTFFTMPKNDIVAEPFVFSDVSKDIIWFVIRGFDFVRDTLHTRYV